MNSVTNKYIWLKCYLNLCLFVKQNLHKYELVADGMRGLQSISDSFKCLLLFFVKKLRNDDSYCFLIFTEISLLSVVTSQDNLSLSSSSRIPAISEGMVVLSDLDFGFCNITFDFTSNNFITPFMLFLVNIFVNILYIFYL